MDSDSKARPESAEAPGSAAPAGRAARPIFAFSTSDLPKAQQAEVWRAGNAPSLDIVFGDERLARAGFKAERQVIPFGSFVMTRVVAESQSVIRTQRHARRDGLDHWCVNLTTYGDRGFRWDRGDRCISVPAGQLHVQALDEAYQGSSVTTEWIGIFFARDSLPTLSAHLDATRDHPRTDALSRMLADYLAGLWAVLPTMTDEERARTAEASAVMMRACLSGGGDALAMAGPLLQEHQRARALAFIRRRLGSSRLTPQLVARALGISRSQLYRAFEPIGGVTQAIQAERLKAAGRLLSREAEGRSIREVAEAVGMFEPSSFSRMFRRHFGMTASEWRSMSRSAADGSCQARFRGFALADFLR